MPRYSVKSGEVVRTFTRRRSDRGKKRVKRPDRTHDELLDFLREKGVRTCRQLTKARRSKYDPTVYDYVKKFKSWSRAVAALDGKLPAEKPEYSEKPEYIITVILMCNAFTQDAYSLARKRMPEMVPSLYWVKKRWGKFRKVVEAARQSSTFCVMEDYLHLARKVGDWPTLERCRRANLDLTEVKKMFGGKVQMDRTLAQCQRAFDRLLQYQDELDAMKAKAERSDDAR